MDMGQNEMSKAQLVTASEHAEHCQRNWDRSQSIPLEDVQALVDIATNMPSKQNEEYFQLVVSVNPELNRRIYDLSIDPDNPETIQRNAQLDAHAVFVWFLHKPEQLNMTEKKNREGFFDVFRLNAKTAIGISSGAVALSACYMGYRTGYNQCFEAYKLRDLMIEWGIENLNDKKNTPELALGVGIPRADTPWNHVFEDDGELRRIVKTETKNIRWDIIE
jgi:hypothetical protein